MWCVVCGGRLESEAVLVSESDQSAGGGGMDLDP